MTIRNKSDLDKEEQVKQVAEAYMAKISHKDPEEQQLIENPTPVENFIDKGRINNLKGFAKILEDINKEFYEKIEQKILNESIEIERKLIDSQIAMHLLRVDLQTKLAEGEHAVDFHSYQKQILDQQKVTDGLVKKSSELSEEISSHNVDGKYKVQYSKVMTVHVNLIAVSRAIGELAKEIKKAIKGVWNKVMQLFGVAKDSNRALAQSVVEGVTKKIDAFNTKAKQACQEISSDMAEDGTIKPEEKSWRFY